MMKIFIRFFLTVIFISLFAGFFPKSTFAQSCSVSPTSVPQGRVSEVTLTATGLTPNTRYEFRYRDENREQHGGIGRTNSRGELTEEIDISRNVEPGPLTINIVPRDGGVSCSVTITVAGATPTPSPTASPTPGPTGSPAPTGSPTPTPSPCPTDDQVSTAFGCIDTSPDGFVTQILNIAIGVAGGIAFILMVIGGIRMLVSAGDPEALAAGRDMLTSAIAGLLFIIFSVVILRIIGLDVLQIPGFGGGD